MAPGILPPFEKPDDKIVRLPELDDEEEEDEEEDNIDAGGGAGITKKKKRKKEKEPDENDEEVVVEFAQEVRRLTYLYGLLGGVLWSYCLQASTSFMHSSPFAALAPRV